jgi:TRAP-type C4-dicarboxylate transport system substrate-binding protein
MKKGLALALTILLTFALLLSACSSGTASSSSGTAASPAASSGTAPSSSPAASGETYTLKMAIYTPDTYLMNSFPDRVSKATNGRITVELYDASSLGTASDALAMCRNGTIDMYFNAAAQTAGEFPVADIVQVPFLAANPTTVSEIIYGLYYGGYLEEFNNDTVPLFFVPTDMQMLGTVSTKIESMDSFKGLKLRVVSGIAVKMVEAFGASVVSMPLSDVYLSLDRGVIDGAMTSPHLMKVNTLYDTLGYLMQLPIHGGMIPLLINDDIFNGLPADLQLQLRTACEAQRYEILDNVSKTYDEGIKACVEGGMELYSVTPEFQ